MKLRENATALPGDTALGQGHYGLLAESQQSSAQSLVIAAMRRRRRSAVFTLLTLFYRAGFPENYRLLNAVLFAHLAISYMFVFRTIITIRSILLIIFYSLRFPYAFTKTKVLYKLYSTFSFLKIHYSFINRDFV